MSNFFKLDRIQCFDCGTIRVFPDAIEWDAQRKVYACSDRLECANEPPLAAELDRAVKKLHDALGPSLTEIASKKTNQRRRRSNRR